MTRFASLILAGLALGPAPSRGDVELADPGSLRKAFDQALSDFDEGQKILSAQPDRARQLFRSAAQKFSSIASGGVVNGRLEFNLGNCFLQAGDLGHAILHYRRAQQLIPGDPLLTDNLALARSRCLTQIPSARGDEVLRSLFFWHYQTSEAGRIRTGLACYVLAFGLLIAAALARRRILTGSAVAVGMVALLCGASVSLGRWSQRTAPPAVVTAMDVVVYRGPGTGYQRQFEQPLQPGVECIIRERRGGWWEIELPDGKSGWIEASSVETLTPTSVNDRVPR